MIRRPSFVVTTVAVLAVVLCSAITTPESLAADRQAEIGRDTPIGQVSLPGVGNAVLLALNSIQIDRDVEVLSGDVVVNDASPGPVLGETELSLDREVTTAAGYSLRADGVDIDVDAFVGGDVVYNQLSNGGTIAGAQVTPLALPVFTELPPLLEPSDRPSEGDVSVAGGATAVLAEGSYGSLTTGTGSVLELTGGDYTFSSISAGPGSALVFAGASRVVVRGRIALGSGAVVAPASGSGATASDVVFHVHGINGLDGALGSSPPAVQVGKQSAIEANLYAPFGKVVFDRGLDLVGAVIARDIHVGRGDETVGSGGALALDSAFGNRAPTADPQTVFTAGAAPIDITLTGSDPEGEDLSFSIASGPSQGSLSAITPIVPPPEIDPETLETVQPPVTSAVVTYTPATAGDLEDSFTFEVSDPAGATGMAVVTINPPPSETPPPPPPDTVVADDGSEQTFEDRPVTLTLTGAAPAGVALTFAIVPASGPANGTLGPLVQGTEVPRRSATVVYTPDTGFLGSDGFDFEACGVIASVTVCDTATVSIEVVEVPVEPPDLAQDQEVTTGSGQAVQISLAGDAPILEPAAAGLVRRVVLRPRAAFLDGAEIGGNVADADDDGLGDNHNALPGSVPGLMSAGVDLSGGAGSNGTVRMHIEWDISSLPSDLQSADVILHTHRGTIDSLDTFFWWVSEAGDGLLADSDFESAAEPIPGVVMPVPSTTEMPVGSDGSFSFSVLGQLQAAAAQGLGYFTIQGRVDESLTGPARGLEVRTTALGNLSSFLEPQLSLTTPGVTPPITYTVTSLPAHGTLKDGLGAAITAVPYALPDARVSYVSAAGFTGSDSFGFQVSDGFTVDFAVIDLVVVVGSCQQNVIFCPDGR